jgi:putative effector of murein hydrolase LrgA (UPF0299 family)
MAVQRLVTRQLLYILTITPTVTVTVTVTVPTALIVTALLWEALNLRVKKVEMVSHGCLGLVHGWALLMCILGTMRRAVRLSSATSSAAVTTVAAGMCCCCTQAVYCKHDKLQAARFLV